MTSYDIEAFDLKVEAELQVEANSLRQELGDRKYQVGGGLGLFSKTGKSRKVFLYTSIYVVGGDL